MTDSRQLKRSLGLTGAALLGLGSMMGTGLFVALALSSELVGTATLICLALAAGVAICNGLNSAQLAAAHPVSGGTYEYAYRFVHPTAGFVAGFLFLLAKTASAATAALGFAAYFLRLAGSSSPIAETMLALLLVIAWALVAAAGIRPAFRATAGIVLTVLIGLFVFSFAAIMDPSGSAAPFESVFEIAGQEREALAKATALMFVAYTGYGRVATLGEEIENPRRNIPRAVALTIGLTFAVYSVVFASAVYAVGPDVLAASGVHRFASLEFVAERLESPGLPLLIAIVAMVSMAGVLLNLILGLSRTSLAMARRKDLPAILARVNDAGTSPVYAVWFVAAIVALIVIVGDIRFAWSFSAFFVLVYYALTNLTAVVMPDRERMFSPILGYIGFSACVFLGLQIEWQVWWMGALVIGAALLVRWFLRRKNSHSSA